jgi:hypothetical protein
VTLTTVARVPYQSKAGFRLGERNMESGRQLFHQAWEAVNRSWVPGALLLFAVASVTALTVLGVANLINASEAKLAALGNASELRLTALINEKSAGLAARIEETGNKSSNDVNEARQRFLSAVTHLTTTSETLGKTAGDVGRLKEDLEKTTNQVQKEIPGLTSSLNATESRLKVTDAKLNATIDSFGGKLTSITDKIQTSKSHEDRYIESFGVTPGSFHSGTFNGRIIAFPLTSEKEAAKVLKTKGFVDTGSRLGGTELNAFIPPNPPRRAASNLPAVLDQSILTISIAARSTQTPSQPSSHPQENPPSPEPGGSR